MSLFTPDTNHILVGLGGSGGRILNAFKMRMWEEIPDSQQRANIPVSILYIDSSDERIPPFGMPNPEMQVMGQDASFSYKEFFNLSKVDLNHILNNIDCYPRLREIAGDVEMLQRSAPTGRGVTAQMRRVGRLLFAANAREYVDKLVQANAECVSLSCREHSHIHIVTSTGGGLGSGALIDAIAQARKTFPDATISVYALVPEKFLPNPGIDSGRYYPNGYAALQELNAFQTGRFNPHDVTDSGLLDLYNPCLKGVANSITLFSNVDELGNVVDSLRELPKIVADHLFTRIFLMDPHAETRDGVEVAYDFDKMGDYALEFDEAGVPDFKGNVPPARTKKISAFNVKRVRYPRQKMLRRLSYAVGISILNHLKDHNGQEGCGFDAPNILLEDMVAARTGIPSLPAYWQQKADMAADAVRKEANPLLRLQSALDHHFNHGFMDEGAAGFYASLEPSSPIMAKEIVGNIESELFSRWKKGDASLVEVAKASELLTQEIKSIRTDLEGKHTQWTRDTNRLKNELDDNLRAFNGLSFLHRLTGKPSQIFNKHQEMLADYYTLQTQLASLGFTRRLALSVETEIQHLHFHLLDCMRHLSSTIEQLNTTLAQLRKSDRHVSDLCDENLLETAKQSILSDRQSIDKLAFALKRNLIPGMTPPDFSALAYHLDYSTLSTLFDQRLAPLVADHPLARKVASTPLLSRLREILVSEEEIDEFAYNLAKQCATLLRLDSNELHRHLKNNEGCYSPDNPSSFDRRFAFISLPEDDEETDRNFSDKLRGALWKHFTSANGKMMVVWCKIPNDEELTVTTLRNLFPMRAIEDLKACKTAYERALHTGDPATDRRNAILLHTEGDGSSIPDLFPTSDE